MKVLVSACLIGQNCKYNAKNNYSSKLISFLEDKEVIAVCPEVLGGLPVPRNSAEIANGCVTDCKGNNVDSFFRNGALMALEIAKKEGIDLAILQSRSPSCGAKQIYDGTFSSQLIPGLGVFAQALKDSGFQVTDIEDLEF